MSLGAELDALFETVLKTRNTATGAKNRHLSQRDVKHCVFLLAFHRCLDKPKTISKTKFHI